MINQFFCFLALSIFFWANEVSASNPAEDSLNHANTYYWLSRARQNNEVDIKKSLHYLQLAESQLSLLDGTVNKDAAEEIRRQIREGKKQRAEQLLIAKEDLINMSPLIPLLSGETFMIETWDSSEEQAVRNSITTFFENYGAAFPKIPHQVYCIILTDERSEGNDEEEVLHRYLNSNTGIYAISKHEVASVLSEEEMASLYFGDIENLNPDTLQKLADAYNPAGIGVFKIVTNDIVDDITYKGLYFSLWTSKDRTFTRNFYADGFAEDYNHLKGLSLLCIILLVAFFIGLIYRKIYRNEGHMRSAPSWFAGLLAISAVLLCFLIKKAFSAIEFKLEDPVFSPSVMGSVFLLAASYCVAPLVINYFSLMRIKKFKNILNEKDVLANIYAGTYLGILAFLFHQSLLRSDLSMSATILLLAVVSLGVTSFRFATVLSDAFTNDDRKESFWSGCFAVFQFILTFIYMLVVIHWRLKEVLLASVVFVTFVWVLPSIVRQIRILCAKKQSQEDDEAPQRGLEWLQSQLSMGPSNYITEGTLEDLIEKSVSYICDDEDGKIELIYLEGDRGRGKTRAARKIADGIAERLGQSGQKCRILFGDCDDPSGDIDESVVYEPFRQALGEVMGVRSFDDPTLKIKKLKENPLLNQGLGTALGIVGLGALNNLLDVPEPEGGIHRVDPREMAHGIANVLTEISKEERIVFILDDTHWIDSSTFELFSTVLGNLCDLFDENQISFIITSRPVMGENTMQELLDSLKEKGIINLLRFEDETFKNDLSKPLLKQLQFDVSSRVLLEEFFIERNYSEKPLYMLQALSAALNHGWIISEGAHYTVSPEAKLSTISDPDDLKSMILELMEGLPDKLKDILKCCSVLGHEFQVSIVASIFKIDVLEVLGLLRVAQLRGLIKDDPGHDDYFYFSDKRTRHNCMVLSRLDDGESLSQMAREYHKRFLEIKWNSLRESSKDIEDLPEHDLIEIATHAAHVKESRPDLCLLFNRLAGEKAYLKGRFQRALNFFANAEEALMMYGKDIPVEEKFVFYLSYASIILDADSTEVKVGSEGKSIEDILQVLESFKEKFDLTDHLMAESLLIESLLFFRSFQFPEAQAKAEEALAIEGLPEELQLRAQFYRALCLPRKDATEPARELELVISEAKSLLKRNQTLLKRVEYLKILAEACNTIGFIYLFNLSEPEKALKHFNGALGVNQLPEINNGKGAAISHTGLGNYFLNKNDLDLAEKHFKENLELSKGRDWQGVCQSNSMLGKIHLQRADKETNLEKREVYYDDAYEAYDQSRFAAGKTNRKLNNLMFAYMGLLDVSIRADKKENVSFASRKLQKVIDQLEKEKQAPQGELHESIEKLFAQAKEI
jgi:tetratricopeptide (TPR) repeat protein